MIHGPHFVTQKSNDPSHCRYKPQRSCDCVLTDTIQLFYTMGHQNVSTLCCISCSVPEYFFRCPSMHSPVGGPTVIRTHRCHNRCISSSRAVWGRWFVTSGVHMNERWRNSDQNLHCSKVINVFLFSWLSIKCWLQINLAFISLHLPWNPRGKWKLRVMERTNSGFHKKKILLGFWV